MNFKINRPLQALTFNWLSFYSSSLWQSSTCLYPQSKVYVRSEPLSFLCLHSSKLSLAHQNIPSLCSKALLLIQGAIWQSLQGFWKSHGVKTWLGQLACALIPLILDQPVSRSKSILARSSIYHCYSFGGLSPSSTYCPQETRCQQCLDGAYSSSQGATYASCICFKIYVKGTLETFYQPPSKNQAQG